MSRKVFLFLLLAFLITVPYAHGMKWENFDEKHTFSSAGWHKTSINIENAHYSSSPYNLVVWNSTSILVYGTNDVYHEKHIENVWVGKYHIAAKTPSKLIFINISSSKTSSFNASSVKEVIPAPFGAAIITSTNVYLFNYQNKIMKYPLAKYADTDFSNRQFLFFTNNILYGYGFSTSWNLRFPSNINGAVVGDHYYVLAKDVVYILNSSKNIIYKFNFVATSMYFIDSRLTLITPMEDDEDGHYWVFTFMQWINNNYTQVKQAMTYLKPEGVVNYGSFISFYDSHYLHILNMTYNLCTNNTFDSIHIGGDYALGINRTSTYVLNYNKVFKTLKDLGHDNDLDWIPDSQDPDDDNDGMPDWWEEKYGLNPDYAGDRNQDPDGDGLTNYQEYLNGTNPFKWDTDGDGLSDGYEVHHGLNPLVPNAVFPMELVNYLGLSLFVVLAAIGFSKGRKSEKDK